MATSVTNISSTININFPKFGESESNAGEFQANFKKIANSFNILGKDINNFINESIKKTDVNDFGTNIIKSAVFQNHSYRVNDIGSIDNGVITLNYREGAYHKCRINSGFYTFNITNWAQRNTLSKIRLEIANLSTATTSTSFIGFSGKIRYFGTPTAQISLTRDSSIFYDIWTTDGGETMSVKLLGSISDAEPVYYGGGGGGGGGGPIPTITSMLPSLWGITGGELVTINGTNFIAGTVVKVSGITISTSTASPTDITFYTSGGTAGLPVSVEVVTANGSTSTYAFYYDNIGGGDGGGGDGGPF